jgi:hypothetical protein
MIKPRRNLIIELVLLFFVLLVFSIPAQAELSLTISSLECLIGFAEIIDVATLEIEALDIAALV